MSNDSINTFKKNRFNLFFFSQLGILFGSLVFPQGIYANIIAPFLFLANILAGVALTYENKKLFYPTLVLFAASALMIVWRDIPNVSNFLRMGTYFIFYIIITYHVILTVWKSEEVDEKVILGLISGYISLGFIGFFILLTIELSTAGSFSGLHPNNIQDSLMYYSFITLLTIGYGDMTPITPLAQKASILIGLTGQFYMIIITTVVLEKYIRHRSNH